MKIGFDLDGVLCNIDVGLLRVIDNMPEDVRTSAEEHYYRERKPELNPMLFLSNADTPFHIITARPSRINPITIWWCAKYYPTAQLSIVSYDPPKGNSQKTIQEWFNVIVDLKAQKIREKELDVYFEDSREIVVTLRLLCPETTIIQYGGRL